MSNRTAVGKDEPAFAAAPPSADLQEEVEGLEAERIAAEMEWLNSYRTVEGRNLLRLLDKAIALLRRLSQPAPTREPPPTAGSREAAPEDAPVMDPFRSDGEKWARFVEHGFAAVRADYKRDLKERHPTQWERLMPIGPPKGYPHDEAAPEDAGLVALLREARYRIKHYDNCIFKHGHPQCSCGAESLKTRIDEALSRGKP